MIKKDDFVDALAADARITKKEAEHEIEFLIKFMEDALRKGEGIEIYNFAKIEVVDRPGKVARNPRTGEAVIMKPGKRIKFTAKKGLKEITKV